MEKLATIATLKDAECEITPPIINKYTYLAQCKLNMLPILMLQLPETRCNLIQGSKSFLISSRIRRLVFFTRKIRVKNA